ncbi:MAG: SLC13 family permease, partial [Gemmatimonadota bacterium]|nr:SLC13 family permease [Gemmatimonadota bacterium]
MDQWIFLAILIGGVVLFLTRALPYEATAALIIAALAGTGLLTPAEALSGLSSPATVTIAAMFILSAGLIRTGALEFLVELLRRGARRSVMRLGAFLASLISLASAFLNNTPVVIMMVPVTLELSRHFKIKPSKLLLPVSYFAILGGTCTLIGTSTNLLVHEAYRAHGGPGFGIFEFAPLGLCFLAIGLLYIALFARKILPNRAPLATLLPEDRGATFVTELLVGPAADLVASPIRDIFPPDSTDVRLLEIVRGEQVLFAGQAMDESVQPEDSLIVEGTPAGITHFIDRHGLRVASVVEDEKRVEVRSMDLSIAEAVVLPDSPFVGVQVSRLGLNRLYGVKVMAIQRHGRQHRYHIRGMRLQGGDVLLLQADRRGLGALRETGSVMVVEGVDRMVVNARRAPIAIGTLAIVVALAALHVAPLSVLAVGGAGVLMATRCLRPREAMDALDPPVLLLIVGSIP